MRGKGLWSDEGECMGRDEEDEGIEWKVVEWVAGQAEGMKEKVESGRCDLGRVDEAVCKGGKVDGKG